MARNKRADWRGHHDSYLGSSCGGGEFGKEGRRVASNSRGGSLSEAICGVRRSARVYIYSLSGPFSGSDAILIHQLITTTIDINFQSLKQMQG